MKKKKRNNDFDFVTFNIVALDASEDGKKH